jgi:hypothetical protein
MGLPAAAASLKVDDIVNGLEEESTARATLDLTHGLSFLIQAHVFLN